LRLGTSWAFCRCPTTTFTTFFPSSSSITIIVVEPVHLIPTISTTAGRLPAIIITTTTFIVLVEPTKGIAAAGAFIKATKVAKVLYCFHAIPVRLGRERERERARARERLWGLTLFVNKNGHEEEEGNMFLVSIEWCVGGEHKWGYCRVSSSWRASAAVTVIDRRAAATDRWEVTRDIRVELCDFRLGWLCGVIVVKPTKLCKGEMRER
jgi:hypothetical protein